MADFSLVPVDYQPDFSDFSLIPVDYDPFGADDTTPQMQTQRESPLQQPVTGANQPDVSASAIGDGSGGSYDNGGYVPGGGLYSPGAGGYVGTETAIEDATFLIPDSGPTRPRYEQVSTGTEASQGFARVFAICVGAGTPTIGDASFGAAAQSNIGIIAAGLNSITSTRGITAYDGNTMMYIEPTNGSASVTVSIDPATRNVTTVQNPGSPA